MGKKHKKLRRKKWIEKCEQRSDKRTAEYVVRQITDVQEQLNDLVPELRMFEHYGETITLGFCVSCLQRLKKKYQNFVDNGMWED